MNSLSIFGFTFSLVGLFLPYLNKKSKKLEYISIAVVLISLSLAFVDSYFTGLDLATVKNYSYSARLNFSGYEGVHGPHIKTELEEKLNKVINFSSGDKVLTLKCDSNSFILLESIVEMYPTYGFGHFYTAACLEMQKNEAWRKEAERAIKVFKLSTSIGGHNSEHDTALKVLLEELKDQKSSKGILERFGSEYIVPK